MRLAGIMYPADLWSSATSQNTKLQATGSHLAQTCSSRVEWKSNLNRLNSEGVETSEKDPKIPKSGTKQRTKLPETQENKSNKSEKLENED